MITYICEKCGLKTNTSVCPHCGGRSAIDKSELFWCSHCNIPTYDEVCPICGNKGKYFTSDARPVFPEERLLLEIMIGKPFLKTILCGMGLAIDIMLMVKNLI